jgi:hypothetical protein
MTTNFTLTNDQAAAVIHALIEQRWRDVAAAAKALANANAPRPADWVADLLPSRDDDLAEVEACAARWTALGDVLAALEPGERYWRGREWFDTLVAEQMRPSGGPAA